VNIRCQAELYNEIHRWVKQDWDKIQKEDTDKRATARYYGMVRDFLKASAQVWAEAWGNPDYMVTKPVTLKAMMRICADLAAQEGEPEDDLVEVREQGGRGDIGLWAAIGDGGPALRALIAHTARAAPAFGREH
jgi:hypothetical protein